MDVAYTLHFQENQDFLLFTIYLIVRVHVLTEAIMKMMAFWGIALCGLVEVNRRFRGAYCLHHQGDDGGSMHL
jgi:hypothetical protein